MKVTQLSQSGTTPRWADDYGDRRTLLHGGAKIDASTIVANGEGKKFVPSGTVVSKNRADAAFHPAVAGEDIIGFVWLDIPDATVNNDVEVYVRGVVKVNYLPAVPAAGILTALKPLFTLTDGK